MLLKRYFFKFKYFIRYNLPEPLWQFFSLRIAEFRAKQYEEKRKSYGKLNPNLIFYVIRRRTPAWGFFSNVFYIIQGLIYAEKNGYIPIVDMENYWVAELSSSKKINGTFNAWCYFFEQVSEYTLEEVYKSRNVILSNGSSILGHGHWLVDRKIDFVRSPEFLKTTGNFLKKYIKLNSTTIEHINYVKKGLDWNPVNTLGIFIRGTSYITYFGAQAEVPSLKYFIQNIRQIITLKSINSIYIATEDFRIYKALCEEFSDLKLIPSVRYEKNLTIKEWELQQKLTYDHAILLGFNGTLKYLTEIELLSECLNFVATPSNASAYALSKSNLLTGVKRIVLENDFMDLTN